MLTEEQIKRLPKFAQNEIRILREQNDRLKAKNEWLEDENRVKVEASNTYVDEGISDHTALPPNCDVRFVLGGHGPRTGWRRTIVVRVTKDGERIQVMGDDQLDINLSLQSGNLFYVSLRD